MATKVTMPLLGQTMEEGTIIKWFKSEGDAIEKGEPLLEVMTDKVNMEVEAPESGIVRKILAQPDDVIPVQGVIAVIGTADESIDDLLGGAAPKAAATPEAPTAAAPTAAAAPAAPEAPVAPVAGEKVIASPAAKRIAREKGIDINAMAGRGTGPNGRIVEKDVLAYAESVKATPLAGKIAADMGVDIAGIAGTGIGGKVTKADVQGTSAPVAETAPSVAAAPTGIGATIPFVGMRKMVAQSVASSAQTAPHVTLIAEVDMSECVALRKKLLPAVEKAYGVRISFTDINAREFPKAN